MILPANKETIQQAAEILKQGGVVAFPTETVYGLGANALDSDAVELIYKIKDRPATNPLIVHVSSEKMVPLVADCSDPSIARRLERIAPFWPGPLSVVLPRGHAVPSIVTAGGESVAVRVPDHTVARDLLYAAGCPIAAPSANRSGYISPTTAIHVQESLGDRVPLILDGGACRVGIESTVISLIGETPSILRPGAITAEELSAALQESIRTKGSANGNGAHHPLPSPGMLAKHYAPRTRLVFRGAVPSSEYPPRVGLVSFGAAQDASDDAEYAAVMTLSATGNLDEVATRLFHALREMDKLELDMVVVDTCANTGMGEAIMDRLRRAAVRD